MNGVLKTVKFIANKVSAVFFVLLIFMTISFLVATQFVAKRDIISGWLTEAETFKLISDNSLQLFGSESEDGEDSLVSKIEANKKLDKAGFEKVVAKTLSADYLKAQTETIINAYYDWLEGKSALNYDVDFSEKISELNLAIADELVTQYQDLPECSELPDESVDPFALTCTYPGYEQVLRAEVESVSSLDDSETRISSKDVDFEINNLDDVKNGFSSTKYLWLTSLFLAIIAGSIMVVTAKNRRKGYMQLGRNVFLTSFLVFIAIFLSKMLNSIPSIVDSAIGPDGANFEIARTIYKPLAEVVFKDISKITLMICAPFMLVGLVIFVLARRVKTEANKTVVYEGNMLNEADEKSANDYLDALNADKLAKEKAAQTSKSANAKKKPVRQAQGKPKSKSSQSAKNPSRKVNKVGGKGAKIQ